MPKTTYSAPDETLITRLRQRVVAAIDANAQSNSVRENAFRQFFLQPNGTEGVGRSAVQSPDVNSMVTAVQAQMVIAFSTDTVVEYEADSREDAQAAKAESTAVNKILVEQNGGFRVFRDAAQNALLYRDGIAKVWWAEDKQTSFVTHRNLERIDLPFAVEDEPGKERRLISYDQDEKVAKVELTETNKRLRCEAISNERFFFDPDWNEPTLRGCPLAGEVHYKTRDELSRMGVKDALIDQLNQTPRYSGIEGSSMKRRGRPEAQGTGTVDKSTETIRCYEVYAVYAEDEDDNRAYLHKCWMGDHGDFWLVDPELASRIPYARGSAFPIANQAEGESLAEKLYWAQEGKTELLRQLQDNIRNCSWGRMAALDGQVNMDDILQPRAGGPIRVKRLDAITPIPVIDVGPSIQAGLEYWDKIRAERGGASLDMVGAEMQLANDTAHGTERVYAAKELLVSYMVRNIAESLIRDVYMLGHSELRTGGNGPIWIEVSDDWMQVDPAQWKPRSHCNVTVGYSMGERMHMQGIIGQLMNAYMALMQTAEGELVSKEGLYKLLTDWAALGLIDNPEKYFVNPTSQAATQVAQGKAQAAEAAQQAAMQMQQQQMDLMKGIEELKASVDQYKTDQKTGFDYFNAVLQAMAKQDEQEMGGAVEVLTAARDAEIARIIGPGGSGSGPGGVKNGAAGASQPGAGGQR